MRKKLNPDRKVRDVVSIEEVRLVDFRDPEQILLEKEMKAEVRNAVERVLTLLTPKK